MLCSKLYIAEKNANPQMQPALFIAGDTLYTESAPENVFVGPGAIDEKLKEQYKLKAMLENGKITGIFLKVYN
jgi:hypothetical protein